jgi:hypothetical protein
MRRLIPKKKAGKFKPQHQNNQLIVALETEEHRGCTQAFFSIASWKEGFTDESHLYKKCGRHGEDAEFIDNDEEQFKKVFNFMRTYRIHYADACSTSQNLDIGTGFTPSSVDSAPDKKVPS